MPFNASSHKYMSGAQQFSVAQIRAFNGSIVPVYIGQRFGSADDGLKCHDYQYVRGADVITRAAQGQQHAHA